jgi:hypothetical protein
VCQSRMMSLVEALANVVVGYGVAVLTQALAFPLFGLEATLRQNLAIARCSRSSRSCGATCCGGRSRDCARRAGEPSPKARLKLPANLIGQRRLLA